MYNTDSIMGASKYAIVTQATMLTAFYTKNLSLLMHSLAYMSLTIRN